MKASESHIKYIEDINALNDRKGKESRAFLKKSFNNLIQRSGEDPRAFLKLAKESKDIIVKLQKVKTFATARESLSIGNKFLQEKKKNVSANI